MLNLNVIGFFNCYSGLDQKNFCFVLFATCTYFIIQFILIFLFFGREVCVFDVNDLIKEHKKIGVVYVSSAVELKEFQKKALTDKLISITSYETMEMNYSVDASLIAGMIIRIGDRVVDSSIKNQLSDLKSDLLKIQLA